jgi:hypothetical protein
MDNQSPDKSFVGVECDAAEEAPMSHHPIYNPVDTHHSSSPIPTHLEVKFSDAIKTRDSFCRTFSFSIMAFRSGSVCFRGSFSAVAHARVSEVMDLCMCRWVGGWVDGLICPHENLTAGCQIQAGQLGMSSPIGRGPLCVCLLSVYSSPLLRCTRARTAAADGTIRQHRGARRAPPNHASDPCSNHNHTCPPPDTYMYTLSTRTA